VSTAIRLKAGCFSSVLRLKRMSFSMRFLFDGWEWEELAGRDAVPGTKTGGVAWRRSRLKGGCSQDWLPH
jgi:hypothetical protein